MMRLLPKSLLGRNVLLIIGIIAIGQMTTATLFLLAVQKPRVDELVAITAAQVKALSATLTLLPPDIRSRYVEEFNHASSLQFELNESPSAATTAPLNLQVRYFMQVLAEKIGDPRDVVWQPEGEGAIWIRVRVGADSHWLRLSGKYLRPHFSALWIAVSLFCGALAFAGAYFIQYRLNQPLRRLAAAATEVGRGKFPAPLPEQAATEIAVVSHNFNAMVSSLANLDAERALMLAGISHDLRTPLTKLRLGLEMLGDTTHDTLLTTMRRHTEEIDTIIEQFIDFARGNSDETSERVDLNTLITAEVEYFAAQGLHFALDLAALPPLLLRPIAIKRLLSNLMQNAAKYAGVGLEVQAPRQATRGEIAIASAARRCHRHDNRSVEQRTLGAEVIGEAANDHVVMGGDAVWGDVTAAI